MNRLTVNMLSIALATAAATGLSACNRDNGGIPAGTDAATSAAPADLDATAANSEPAAAPAAAPAPVSQREDSGVHYARVVSVEPVRKMVGQPKEVCHDETVTHRAPPKDEHRVAGTAIGAVVGGLVGNQIGGGKGKTLATVAGAVGGGYAGNKIQERRQHDQVTTTVERQCSTVDRSHSKIVGYDVRYVYGGVTRTARMDHDPGDRIEVQNGVVAVSDAR